MLPVFLAEDSPCIAVAVVRVYDVYVHHGWLRIGPRVLATCVDVT